ncbi:histone-lysine N-methyltransferase EZH1-like [Paramacrobiotus metropolitanus]|uniref:histone-lysine N-methyltransferase EZH1-like n=1 Tax=Paramacrobiotus metropolitanus TaxID=2943436 RepID=UPI0024460315|nr:histone-lysine N-methyltransferase EZH1-like [Paramacrobiotus metropolitanus]
MEPCEAGPSASNNKPPSDTQGAKKRKRKAEAGHNEADLLVDTKPPVDPELQELIDVACKCAKKLEKRMHSTEEEEGREKFLDAIKAISQHGHKNERCRPADVCHPEMLELPNYYNPWENPVSPARDVDGNLLAESQYVKRSYLIGKTVDSECGPARELPLIEKLPGYFAWSSLPRNEVVEDEKVFACPAVDQLDSKFIKEYEKQYVKTAQTVECRRTRNLFLSDKWIKEIVESVNEHTLKEPSTSSNGPQQQNIPEKVFHAISEAFGGTETPVGVMHRYYRSLGQPRHTYLHNLGAETGKPPTVSRFIDSINRILCTRCFRYDCLEHPYKSSRNAEVYPLVPPSLASNPCGDHCHQNKPTKTAIPLSDCAPLTLADKAILKTFMTEGDEQSYSYCDLAVVVDRPCQFTHDAIRELLMSPDEAEYDETNGIQRRARARQKAARRFASAPAGRRMRQDLMKEGHVRHFQYIPCNHGANVSCDDEEICTCVDRRTYCERYCDCPSNCANRFPGCNCVGDCRNNRCPCYVARRECDPELCRCQAKLAKGGCCKNTAILFNSKKRVKCGPSDIHGWGAFIMEDAKTGEFIMEYTGEVISQEEAERRGKLYDQIKVSYLFDLNVECVVDAARKGNKIRYANHSKLSPNCYPEIFRVQGENRIGIFARRDLLAGEELFFDYSYSAESLKFVQIEPAKAKAAQNGNQDFRIACIVQNMETRQMRTPRPKKGGKSGNKVSKQNIQFREMPVKVRLLKATMACENSDDEEENNKELQSIMKGFDLIEPSVLRPVVVGEDAEGKALGADAVKAAYRMKYPSYEDCLKDPSQFSSRMAFLSSLAQRAEQAVCGTVPGVILDSPEMSSHEPSLTGSGSGSLKKELGARK